MGKRLNVQNRVQLEDGRAAKIVDYWTCTPDFDGSNMVCAVSRNQWSCTDLARTRSGLWLRVECGDGPGGGYQGAVTGYSAIGAEEAAGLAAALDVEIPDLEDAVV